MLKPTSRGVSEPDSETPRGISGHPLRARVHRFRWLFMAGLGVLGVYFLIVWINSDEPTPQSLAPGSPLQVEALRSFVVRKNGQKYWEFRADRVLLSPDGKTTTAQNVSRAVLYREGREFLTLRAPHVRLSNTTSDLDARGGVMAQGPDNFSFRTQTAHWKNQKKRVVIPGSVKARLRNLDLHAQRLNYDWEKGVLQTDKPLQITTRGASLNANRARASLKTRKIELGGGVRLVFDPRERSLQKVLQSNLKPSN